MNESGKWKPISMFGLRNEIESLQNLKVFTCTVNQLRTHCKMLPTKRIIHVVLIFQEHVHALLFDNAFESNVPSNFQ